MASLGRIDMNAADRGFSASVNDVSGCKRSLCTVSQGHASKSACSVSISGSRAPPAPTPSPRRSRQTLPGLSRRPQPSSTPQMISGPGETGSVAQHLMLRERGARRLGSAETAGEDYGPRASSPPRCMGAQDARGPDEHDALVRVHAALAAHIVGMGVGAAGDACSTAKPTRSLHRLAPATLW